MTEIELLQKIATLLELQIYIALMYITLKVVIRNVRKGGFRR